MPHGLIAHGRGEAFDYLLGETTPRCAEAATSTAAALLLSARNPVISVNGNTVSLVPREIVRLARAVPAQLEVNLFHKSSEREQKIGSRLKRAGAPAVFGLDPKSASTIKGVTSDRRVVDKRGIGDADVVLVPLEDGDRTEALRKAGKKVIAIDLNPMSRTSRSATVTIVDNITRAIPRLNLAVARMKRVSKAQQQRIISSFDNERNLSRVTDDMIHYLRGWSKT